MSETKTKWHWLCKGEPPPNNSREVLLAVKYDEIPIQAYYKSLNKQWYGSKILPDSMNNVDVFDGKIISDNTIPGYFQAWCELPEMPPTFHE